MVPPVQILLRRDPLAEAGFVIPPWCAGFQIRRERGGPAGARESGGGRTCWAENVLCWGGTLLLRRDL